MNETDELSEFLIDWGNKYGYTFFVPEGNDTITTFYIDVPKKKVYINGVDLNSAVSPN